MHSSNRHDLIECTRAIHTNRMHSSNKHTVKIGFAKCCGRRRCAAGTKLCTTTTVWGQRKGENKKRTKVKLWFGWLIRGPGRCVCVWCVCWGGGGGELVPSVKIIPLVFLFPCVCVCVCMCVSPYTTLLHTYLSVQSLAILKKKYPCL